MAWWADVDGCGTHDRPVDGRDRRPAAADPRPARPLHRPPARPRGRGDRDPGRRRAARPRPLRRLVHPAREHALVAARPDRPPLRRVPGPRVSPRPTRASRSATATGRPTSRPSTTTTATVARGHARTPSAGVPIVRVFDRRKPRCRNIGQSRYEGIAERQREYYNRDSELILSDTTQAHPLLQGPEDFVQADGTIPIGPSWLLPKKKNTQGGATTYEGFDVVEFPKDGAESIRRNKADLRDDVDRDSALVRPTGPRRRGAVGPVEDVRPLPTATTGWPRSPRSWRAPSEIVAELAPDGPRRRRRPIPASVRDRDRLPDRVRPVHGRRRGRRRRPTSSRWWPAPGPCRVTEGLMLSPPDAALPARPGRRPVRRVRRGDRGLLSRGGPPRSRVPAEFPPGRPSS